MGSDTTGRNNVNFRDVFVDCRPRLKPNTILFKTGNRAVRIEPTTVTIGASEGIPGGLVSRIKLPVLPHFSPVSLLYGCRSIRRFPEAAAMSRGSDYTKDKPSRKHMLSP